MDRGDEDGNEARWERVGGAGRGPRTGSAPGRGGRDLGEIIRAYLAAHHLEATVELEQREWTDEHPTARAGVRRVHPDEHRRSAVA